MLGISEIPFIIWKTNSRIFGISLGFLGILGSGKKDWTSRASKILPQIKCSTFNLVCFCVLFRDRKAEMLLKSLKSKGLCPKAKAKSLELKVVF